MDRLWEALVAAAVAFILFGISGYCVVRATSYMYVGPFWQWEALALFFWSAGLVPYLRFRKLNRG